MSLSTSSRVSWLQVWNRCILGYRCVPSTCCLQKKKELAIEKPKLERARKLREIYSVDPSDEEYKDILKNARRKLETPKEAPMPCKRAFSQACLRVTVVSKTGKAKASEANTRFTCISEAHESRRQRIESVTKRRIHEENIAGKGQNFVLHYNLVHKFIPMPQAMKIPEAKAAVDGEWKKLETIPAWDGFQKRHRKTTIKFTLLHWGTYVI